MANNYDFSNNGVEELLDNDLNTDEMYAVLNDIAGTARRRTQTVSESKDTPHPGLWGIILLVLGILGVGASIPIIIAVLVGVLSLF